MDKSKHNKETENTIKRKNITTPTKKATWQRETELIRPKRQLLGVGKHNYTNQKPN